MGRRILLESAVKRIGERGVLLVFPINNRPLPLSIWSEFYPKTRMVWDWNDDAAGPVHDMWGLMKRLSDCRQVVYSKWYQGRATFFSRELFAAMLSACRVRPGARRRLSPTASALYEVLENNSPISTRKLKELTDLQGRFHEAEYNRGMKELFTQLWIVGFGEVDDGAFPSLAVGATELLYDELWRQAEEMPVRKAQDTINRWMPEGSHFRRFFDKASQ